MIIQILICSLVLLGRSAAEYHNERAYNGLVMSYSAYCFNKSRGIDTWTCPLNGGVCGRQLSERFFDVDEFHFLGFDTGDLEKDNLFYVAQLFLVFRGTDSNIINDLQDLDFVSQDIFPQGSSETNSLVSHGFFQAWYEDILGHDFGIRDLVQERLSDAAKKYPNNELVILGHSLGGALASLAALDIIYYPDQWANFTQVSVYTYGSPRVGNDGFAELFNRTVVESYRVVSLEDTIPHLPLPSLHINKIVDIDVLYSHVSTEVWIIGPTGPLSYPDIYICPGTENMTCSAGSSVPWTNFNSVDAIMADHRGYYGFDLEHFCDDWSEGATETPSSTPNITVTPSSTPNITVTPSSTPNITVTPSSTPNITVTPSSTPNITATPSFLFPVITQQITSQWSSYMNVVGTFNNSGPTDLEDPIWISNPNIIPIGMVGLKSTIVNGVINWRLSPAGSWTQFMPKGSYMDFGYTIQSSQVMTFTRIK
eukprot:gene17291-20630_t